MKKICVALLSLTLTLSMSVSNSYAVNLKSSSAVETHAVKANVKPTPQLAPTPSPTPTPLALPRFSLSNNKAVLSTAVSTTVATSRSTGGAIRTFSVSPSLPRGLRINASTGEISGKPTFWQKAKKYKVIARNATGVSSQSISIQVIRIPILRPGALDLGLNIRMKPAGLKNTGGTASEYSISPELPLGLNFNTKTGKISGKPSLLQPRRTYVLAATNISGTSKKKITIEVVAKPEINLSKSDYLVSPNASFRSYTIKSTGGRVYKYSISPALPSGLKLNIKTGKISGSPANPVIKTRYTLKGTNPAGSTSKALYIEVLAPPSFTVGWYGLINNAHLGTGKPFSGTWMSSNGGEIKDLQIEPALPTGISFDPITKTLSGTPISKQASKTYTITGTNIAGSMSKQFTIDVVDAPNLTMTPKDSTSYSTSGKEKLALGETISGYQVSNSSDAVDQWSISPELPYGLSLDSNTGEISGSPQGTLESDVTYTITGTNPGGTSSFEYRLQVVAPPLFTLSSYSEQLAVGGQLAGYTLSSIGGLIDDFSISGTLPSWLTFDPATGLLSGIADAAASLATWTITATNVAGSSGKTFSLEVFDAPQFTLSSSSRDVVNGQSLDPLTNSYYFLQTGGRVTSYSISPEVPQGITFNTETGSLEGTPTVDQAPTTYTITGTNVAGSDSHTFELGIYTRPSIELTTATENGVKGSPIVGYSITQSGGTPKTYSISPAAPAGLVFDTSTGILSGTPTAIQKAITYTITGTNVAGSSQATFTLDVADPPVIALSTSSFLAYVQEVPTLYSITSTGGAVASYEISPSLPAGLELNATTGLVSGTPTGVSSATEYTLTGRNVAGTSSKTFTLEIRFTCATGGPCSLNDVGPGGGKIVYVNRAGFLCGVDMTSTCHYLEAASKTFAGVAEPRNVLYGTAESTAGRAELITNEAGYTMGRGRFNTELLRTAVGSFSDNPCAFNRATRYVSVYKGNILNDWYLPNIIEMQTVASVLPMTTGDWGLTPKDRYWTSVQRDTHTVTNGPAVYEWAVGTDGYSTRQIPSPTALLVRPVRTF